MLVQFAVRGWWICLALLLPGCGAIWDQLYPIEDKRAQAGFYLSQATYEQGLLSFTPRGGGQRLYLQQQPLVTGSEIQSATPMVDASGHFFVAIRLKDSGARKLAQATAKSHGQSLALRLGDQLLGAAPIDGPIDKGLFAMATRDRASAIALAQLLSPAP